MRELDTLLRDIENEVDSNKIEKAIEKVIEIRDRELEKGSEIDQYAMRVFSILQKLNSFEKIKQKTLKNGILDAIVALGYIGYNPIYNSTMEILDADKPDKDKNKRFDAVNVLERFLETEKRHIEEIKSELERISKEDGDSMVEERAKLILERMKKS